MSDELLVWRDEFPILERTTYLISNSLGAMPRGVAQSLESYSTTWAERGVRAWGDCWWEMPVRMGDQLAPILGVESGEVSFHPNVTLATAVVLSCLDFSGPRRKIVYTSMEFPSVIYLCREQSRRGAEMSIVESDDGIRVDLERLIEAIDEKTLLVLVSHVLFRSAFIQDVEAIVGKAHRVGAHVILDVYQSAGTVPIFLDKWKVDFAVGGCLKWLCGGPGAAFLHVRKDLASRLRPALTGWLAHRESFAFETGDIRLREDAFRFLNGTPPIPCLYAARPGLEIIRKIGIDPIRRKSRRQVSDLIDRARGEGFSVTAPDREHERGGTVAINPPHAYEVCRELIRREFLVDYRPGAGIRVSPHFYTSDAEIEAVVCEIRKILDSHAYERHCGRREHVT